MGGMSSSPPPAAPAPLPTPPPPPNEDKDIEERANEELESQRRTKPGTIKRKSPTLLGDESGSSTKLSGGG